MKKFLACALALAVVLSFALIPASATEIPADAYVWDVTVNYTNGATGDITFVIDDHGMGWAEPYKSQTFTVNPSANTFTLLAINSASWIVDQSQDWFKWAVTAPEDYSITYQVEQELVELDHTVHGKLTITVSGTQPAVPADAYVWDVTVNYTNGAAGDVTFVIDDHGMGWAEPYTSQTFTVSPSANTFALLANNSVSWIVDQSESWFQWAVTAPEGYTLTYQVEQALTDGDHATHGKLTITVAGTETGTPDPKPEEKPAASGPVIDGQIDDMYLQGGKIVVDTSSPVILKADGYTDNDLVCTSYILMDNEWLYFAAKVEGDTSIVDTNPGGSVWWSDSVELWIMEHTAGGRSKIGLDAYCGQRGKPSSTEAFANIDYNAIVCNSTIGEGYYIVEAKIPAGDLASAEEIEVSVQVNNFSRGDITDFEQDPAYGIFGIQARYVGDGILLDVSDLAIPKTGENVMLSVAAALMVLSAGAVLVLKKKF